MTDVEAGAVARRAMGAVERGAREEWLGLFADDATVEDPVGGAPGRHGAAAIAEFWDTGIALLDGVQFDVRRVHEAHGEALVLADVAIRAPGGARARYDAAIHYRLDEAGGIASLRAFWDLPAVMAQLAAA